MTFDIASLLTLTGSRRASAPPRAADSLRRLARTLAGLTLAAATLVLSSQPAAAQQPEASYLYTGRNFTLFSCVTSPSVDCATPGTGNPYSASNSVTATLTLTGGPLASGLTAFDLFEVGFQLVMSDGHQMLSSSSASPQACVSTDDGGNISAWYLSLSSEGGQLIFSMNGLTSACLTGGGAEDFGRFVASETNIYAYNLGLPGRFSPAYRTGSTDANNCIAPQHCDLVGGVLPFTITDPLNLIGTLPPSRRTITQQLCVVPADPRGRNCGATDDQQPRRLKVSDVCPGFGATVIPAYLCGSSGLARNGTQGTGFALIRGVAEGVDSLNGVIVDFSSTIDAVLPSPGNLQCPKKVGAVGTRTDSLVEEQTPEGPLLLEMTTGCDEAHQSHPGASIESAGLKLRLDDTRFDNDELDVPPLVSFTRYKFRNLLTIVADTNFTEPLDQTQLTTCIKQSRNYLNNGAFDCAAEKVFQCDQNVRLIGAGDFGPATSPLRLPDPFGDIDSRLGNLFYTINTRIRGNAANPDWPLTTPPVLCPNVSPYPSNGG